MACLRRGRGSKLEGDRLLVNVDAGAGEVTVEVLDEMGKPIPGYSGKDAASARGIDALGWPPRWKDHTDLSALKNRTVCLRFTLRDAKLYALQVQ
jgi:hypothetical protein